MRLKSFAAALAVLGVAAAAAAQQTGTVSGTLTNTLSGDPVANATVVLESPALTRQVRSGADGKYSVADVPTGAYHLFVRADGYLPARTEVAVQAGSQTCRRSGQS